MAVDSKALAGDIRKWATEELHFRPTGRFAGSPVPSVEEFEKLCHGNLLKVWQFLIEQVRPASTTQKIKGNIKLHSVSGAPSGKKHSEESSEKDNLLEELRELREQHAEINRSTFTVRSEIKRLKKDISKAESKISQAFNEVEDVQKRVALLSAHSKSCSEWSRFYQELSHRIQLKTDKWRNVSGISRETTFYSKAERSNKDFPSNTSSTAELESACMRQVRETCESIASSKQEKLAEETSYDRSYSQTVSRDDIWTKIENTVSQNKADEIIRSLEMNTKQSTDSLREMTDGIDLRRDAEELKFKFESGKLKDVSTQPTLLQSVHQLIEEGQKMHFHRFMETEKAQNTLWKTKKRIESTQSQIDNILAKKHGSSSHSLTLMSAILKLEAELFGAEISIKYIKGVINDLRNQKCEKQHALELLHKKYQKIQDFEALAQSKQLMIQNLVKENGSARVRLEQQCIELNAFVKKNLQSIGKDIQSASKKLQGSVAKEVETFAKMPIYQLRTVEFERGARQPVEELSIYRLEESKYLPGNVVIQSLLDKLEFCPYLAPEKLLDFVKNIKQEALDLETQIKLKSDLVDRQQVDSISSALDRVKDLCTEVNVSDAEQVESSMPVLNSGLSKATDALTSCLNLRSATQAWWDQPAQFLVPWIKEDELSLRQWHDLWSVNATRLTQLQLAK